MEKSQEKILKEKVIEPLKALKTKILEVINDNKDKANIVIKNLAEELEDEFLGDIIINHDEEDSNESLEVLMEIGRPSGQLYLKSYVSIQIDTNKQVNTYLQSSGYSIDIKDLMINQLNDYELSLWEDGYDEIFTTTLDKEQIELTNKCIESIFKIAYKSVSNETNKGSMETVDKEELLRGYIVNPLKTIYNRIIRLGHKDKRKKVKSKIANLICYPEFHWVEREIERNSDGYDVFMRVPIGTMYEDPEKEVSFCISISPSGLVRCDINYYDKFIDVHLTRMYQNENGYITIWDAYEDFQEVCDINKDMVNRAYKLILAISSELNKLVPQIKGDELGRLNKAINKFISIKGIINEKPNLMCSTEFFNDVFKWMSSKSDMSDINYDSNEMSISLTIRYQNKIIQSYERVIIKLKYNKNKGIVESILDDGKEHIITELDAVNSCDYERGAINIMTFLGDDEQCLKPIVILTEISREGLFSLEGQIKSLKAFVNKQVNMDSNQEYEQRIMAVEPNKSIKPTEAPFDKTKALKGIVVALTEIRNSLNSLAEEKYFIKAKEIMPIINNDEEASGLISSDDDNVLSVMLEYGPKESIEITLEHGLKNNCDLYIHVRDEFHMKLSDFSEVYDMHGTSVMMVRVDKYNNFGITISRKHLELLSSEISKIANRLLEL